MPWNNTPPTEQRLKFVTLANSGRFSVSELCEEFGISRKSGHKWLVRHADAPSPGGVFIVELDGVGGLPRAGVPGKYDFSHNLLPALGPFLAMGSFFLLDRSLRDKTALKEIDGLIVISHHAYHIAPRGFGVVLK